VAVTTGTLTSWKKPTEEIAEKPFSPWKEEDMIIIDRDDCKDHFGGFYEALCFGIGIFSLYTFLCCAWEIGKLGK